jgi:hypothetical protein
MAFDLATIVTSAVVSAAVGAAVSVAMQGRTRWIETQTHAVALSREVLSARRKLERWRQEIQANLNVTELGSSPAAQAVSIPPVPLTAADMIVFAGNTSKLGLLPDWLVSASIQAYGWIRELQADYAHAKSVDRETAHRIMKQIYEIGRYIDGRVITELEVIVATPYRARLRYKLRAWRETRRTNGSSRP